MLEELESKNCPVAQGLAYQIRTYMASQVTQEVTVNLDTNILYRRADLVQLTPNEAVAVYVMLEATPAYTHSHVFQRSFYGAMAKDNRHATKFMIHKLRQKLAPLGIKIANTYKYGYRLELT